jgi:putative phosphoribosyl transferase
VQHSPREDHMPNDQFQTSVVSVTIQTAGIVLIGDLAAPRGAHGIVIFAHGSGSSRLSPRNREVAAALVGHGFATLLFDLLTRDEEISERYTRHLRFNIPLLADRLIGVIEWVARAAPLAALPIGLFGASTGAAAALIAAARTGRVGAVVSRGGRPDLADDALPDVRCPTLLIVGGDDVEVIELNRRAMRKLSADATIHIVPGAGHLFEEPGALSEVIQVATGWFRKHLTAGRARDELSDVGIVTLK